MNVLFSVLGSNKALSAFELLRNKEIKIVNFYKNFITFNLKDNDCTDKQIADLNKSLGGSVKLGKVLFECTQEAEIISRLQECQVGGNIFAVSDYTDKKPEIKKLKTHIKGLLKTRGFKPRFLDNKTREISTASLFHNKVIDNGFEICLFYDRLAKKYIVGQTVSIQDLEFYSRTDFNRPDKDLEYGILNPKVAKIMINLCQPEKDSVLYDPFCGSGTILMEGLIVGLSVLGSDSSSKAIEKCYKNLEWFCEEFDYPKSYKLFEHDARYPKKDLDKANKKVNLIVTEPFLGPQISKPATIQQFSETRSYLLKIYKKSFANFKTYLSKGSLICFVLPVTKTEKGFRDTFFAEQLETMGFNIIRPAKLLPEIYQETTKSGVLVGYKNNLVKKEVILAHI